MCTSSQQFSNNNTPVSSYKPQRGWIIFHSFNQSINLDYICISLCRLWLITTTRSWCQWGLELTPTIAKPQLFNIFVRFLDVVTFPIFVWKFSKIIVFFRTHPRTPTYFLKCFMIFIEILSGIYRLPPPMLSVEGERVGDRVGGWSGD